MILAASSEQAARNRASYTAPSGAQTTVDTYIGTNRAMIEAGAAGIDPAGLYPMAYLVSQPPGSRLDAHYHQADQFQVIVGGSGRIGTHPVQPLVVHFAGAHSPYGPLVAGPLGLQYLTLRRNWDPGARYMPQSAQALRDVPARRHRTHTSASIDLAALPALPPGTSRVDCLFADNSMGAWLIRFGPGASHSAQTGADRFIHVLSGSIEIRAAEHAAGACLFVSADEGSLAMRAAAHGTRIVLTQFDPPEP